MLATVVPAIMLFSTLMAEFANVEQQLAAGQYSAAYSLLNAVPAPSRNASWHLLSSRAFDGLNQVPEAVKEAESAINLDSKNEAAHLQLAQVFLSRNTPEAALEILQAAEPAFPESPLIHLGLGLALKEMRRYEEAASELNICLRIDPAFGTAFEALGSVYLSSGSFDELLRLSTGYTERNPSDYRGWYSLAAAHEKLGAKAGTTLPVLRKCVGLNPKFAAGFALMGKVQLDSGDLPGAVSSLEQAIQLRPGYTPAHLSLAAAYSRMGRKHDASREAAELARLNEEQSKPVPHLLYHRGHQ